MKRFISETLAPLLLIALMLAAPTALVWWVA